MNNPQNEERIKDIIKETMKDVLKDNTSNNNITEQCCLNKAGISCQEHIDHHKSLIKWKSDMQTVTKAVLAALATIGTGGIFGLIWLGIQSKLGGK